MYIPATFFSTDLFWSSLKWLMILMVWGLFAWSTWREDRKVRQLLDKPIEERDALTLLRTLHRRDMQIWLQVSLLLIVVAANDIHHDASLLPTDFFAAPAPPPPPVLQAKEPPDDRYDKLLRKNAGQGLPFSDITAFNEQNGKREAYIDLLKERYESWLVTYYYLDKCKAVSADDYALIRHLLEKDLEGAHADAAVEGNILLAATGSYKEMYSNIPCDGAHLGATKSTYDANIQQARGIPPQNSANPTPAATEKAGGAR